MHNSKYLLNRMEKKGWSKEELEHASIIFSEHKIHHHIFSAKWDYLMYWIIILVIICSNIVAFFFMLPMIIVFNNVISYIFIIILGLALGLSFEIMIKDLTHLDRHHHFLISVLVPAFAVLSFLVLMYLIQIKLDSLLNTFKEPILTSFIYATSFMIPYYVRRIKEKTN